MYKIFMLIALPVVAIGWIAYVMWERKMREEEKKQPKKESQRLTKTKSEISDWAQQMAAYKPPPRKKYSDEEPEDQQQNNPDKQGYLIVLATAWIPVIAYRFFYLNVLMKPGEIIISDLADTLLLWLSFHLSLFCLLYLLIHTFRVYLDKQGKLSKALNRNSYHVYIIHTVVMGLLAFAMPNITLPSLLKFLLLTIFTFGLSSILIDLYRKVIPWKNGKKRK